MAIAVNAAKARLKKNELSIGIGIRLVRNVDIIKVMKAAGFDWLFIDLEHGSMSIETACEISVAAQDSGIAPIVRVPYGELTMATRVLDGGALGVVIPHVDTPEEAKEIADKLRYPPRGHRSVGGGQAQFDYATHATRRDDDEDRRQHLDHGDDRDAQGGRRDYQRPSGDRPRRCRAISTHSHLSLVEPAPVLSDQYLRPLVADLILEAGRSSRIWRQHRPPARSHESSCSRSWCSWRFSVACSSGVSNATCGQRRHGPSNSEIESRIAAENGRARIERATGSGRHVNWLPRRIWRPAQTIDDVLAAPDLVRAHSSALARCRRQPARCS